LWRRDRAGTPAGPGLVHHSDAGSQYTSFAFTAHLIEAGIDASIGTVGKPLPGNRNDCQAWEDSGTKTAVGTTPTVIADGGYRGTGLTIPHYRRHKNEELPAWKEEHNASHRKVRARVEHTFARMKSWKILRDCRLKGEGVHHAMLGIARLYNLTLTG